MNSTGRRPAKAVGEEAAPITVAIPSALRSLCGGRADLRLAARDLRALFGELRRLHPEVHRRLFDDRGEPRPHINVFVNEDHVRDLAGFDTALKPGDVVTFLPAVSGGSPGAFGQRGPSINSGP